jgi:hypothetical protein
MVRLLAQLVLADGLGPGIGDRAFKLRSGPTSGYGSCHAPTGSPRRADFTLRPARRAAGRGARRVGDVPRGGPRWFRAHGARRDARIGVGSQRRRRRPRSGRFSAI